MEVRDFEGKVVYIDSPDTVSKLVAESFCRCLQVANVNSNVLSEPIGKLPYYFKVSLRDITECGSLAGKWLRAVISRDYYKKWLTFSEGSIGGIQAGDCILAIALRSRVQAENHISFSLRVARYSFSFFKRYFKYKFLMELGIDYHLIWEANYLDKYIDRALFASGSTRIYLSFLPEKIALYRHSETIENHGDMLKARVFNGDRRMVNITEDIISRFMDSRLYSLDQVTFLRGITSEEREVYSAKYQKGISDRSIQEENTLNAVVFCHSFSDAQLNYGPAVFVSMHDWLLFTIESLLDLGYRVSVKPHPTIAYGVTGKMHSGDRLDLILWEEVIDRYRGLIDIVDIGMRPAKLLCQFPENTLFASHHGQVIGEIAYAGGNTISSVASPWGSDYKLGLLYSSIEEYRSLLGRFKDGRVGGKTEKKEILRYIRDYYFFKSQSYSDDIVSVGDALHRCMELMGHGGVAKSVTDLLIGIDQKDIKGILSSSSFKDCFVGLYSKVLLDTIRYLEVK